MLISILFLFTLGLVIVNFFFLISVITGHPINVPEYKFISPLNWFFFYGSLYFQVWWWSIYFNLI